MSTLQRHLLQNPEGLEYEYATTPFTPKPQRIGVQIGYEVIYLQTPKGWNLNNPGWQPGDNNPHPLTRAPKGLKQKRTQHITK